MMIVSCCWLLADAPIYPVVSCTIYVLTRSSMITIMRMEEVKISKKNLEVRSYNSSYIYIYILDTGTTLLIHYLKDTST